MGVTDDIKKMVSGEEKDSVISIPDADKIDSACFDACGLDYVKRVYAFLIFFGIGWLLSGLSFLMLSNPSSFALLYTLGNIFSICSGFFMSGPCNQLKGVNCFVNPVRGLAALVVIVMLGVTLYVATHGVAGGLIFLCVLVQFAAMSVYFVTTLPGGQWVVKRLCCGTSIFG